MKVLIIGGVAGGATAAARLRRLNEKAEIIVFEKSGYVSYANCGLPYYIGGIIENKKALTLQTPASFKKRFNIDVRVNSEVLSINPKERTLFIKDLQSGKTDPLSRSKSHQTRSSGHRFGQDLYPANRGRYVPHP